MDVYPEKMFKSVAPRRVAVDLDEVLVPLLRPMMKHYKVKAPDVRKFPYDYTIALGKTRKEAQAMLFDYYDTDDFKNQTPILGSWAVMQRLRDSGSKLYVLTGRQECVKEQTEEWVERNFPYIFDDVILTNSYTPSEIPKQMVCKAIKADAIIDDNYFTCLSCSSSLINAVNYIGYPVYPWCEPNRFSSPSWGGVEQRLFREDREIF